MQFILRFGLLAICLWAVACSENSSSASDFDAASVCPENLRGTFIDDRDGQVYKYTTIGNQIWMAENLNYDSPHSYCYEGIDNFCEIFGRFYSLMKNEEFGQLDSNLVASVCPTGWKIPSEEDWDILIQVMGNGDEELAAERLKSQTYWGYLRKSGIDACGFNVLPAGYALNFVAPERFGIDANFVSTPNFNSDVDYYNRNIYVESSVGYVNLLGGKISIRCIKE